MQNTQLISTETFDYSILDDETRDFYTEIEQQADSITYEYRYAMGLLIQTVIEKRGKDEAFAWAIHYLHKSQSTIYRYLQVARGEDPYAAIRERTQNERLLQSSKR